MAPVQQAEHHVGRRDAVKIRVGVGLVVLSWLPFAQLAIALSGASGSSADELRGVIWGIQVVVGLVGVAIAGKETIDLAKSFGWRQLPREVWRLLWSGSASSSSP